MSLVVALSATVTTGCDPDPGAQIAQRDVYVGPHAFESCVADWGNADLCNKRLTAEDAKRMAEANRSGGSGGPVILYSGGYGTYGPAYSGSDRAVVHNGQTVKPSLNRATRMAAFQGPAAPGAKPAAFTKPRPMGVTTTSRPVNVSSRGGFGATGRGMSGIG